MRRLKSIHWMGGGGCGLGFGSGVWLFDLLPLPARAVAGPPTRFISLAHEQLVVEEA